MRKFIETVVAVVGAVLGSIIGCALVLAAFIGVGVATGRAVDLLQGAQTRMLSDWSVALDGWAVILTAYLLLWLPLSALARSVRAPPRVELDVDD